MKRKDEEDIVSVERVLAGHFNDFEVLVKKYEGEVYRIVARKVPYQDVAEVAHEVFIKAYKSLGKFRKTGSFGQWLTTIAVRTCHDYWRSRYRNREVSMNTMLELQDMRKGSNREPRCGQIACVSDAISRSEDQDLLNWALAHLGATDRMILVLTYFDGYSVAETAKLLGISVANVKVRSFRARKKLRGVLKAFRV